MKNKFKILSLSAIAMFTIPTIVNATNLTFEEASSTENTKTYNIVNSDAESASNTIQLKLYKTNDNLKYSIKSQYGDCTASALSCTLLFLNDLPANSTIAEVTITNDTEAPIETMLSFTSPAGMNATKSFSVNGKTTTTTTSKIRSNDSTLKNIILSVGTFDQTFSPTINTYNITGIKDTINSVKITPECDNCSWEITCPQGDCTVSNSNKINLKTGANQVGINVTSEDGSSKRSYVLNIYRGEITTSSAYLSSLKINNAKLSPNFDSLVNDYSVKVGLDVDKLDIVAVTEDPNADVIIKGNENLKEGKNTITITVTSSDGANKQVYTLNVTKEKINDNKDDKEKEKKSTTSIKKKKNNTWLIILISFIGLGLIILAYFLIFKRNKNKKDKNNKNDKNNKDTKEEIKENSTETTKEQTDEEKESTLSDTGLDLPLESMQDELENLRKLESENEPKQDVDEALDDLMKTKKLELGDLDF